MRTYDYLIQGGHYWEVVVTALIVGVVGGVVSVPVVLKRLAFIGQGVSHAAFGGVGVAALLVVAGVPLGATGVFGIVGVFCVAAALGIAFLSARRGSSTDTAIGIVLAMSMAVGFLLHRRAVLAYLELPAPDESRLPPGLEQVLFGSILTVTWADALIAGVVGAAILGVAWWTRRWMLFWAFDEPAAGAFGVRTGAARVVLLTVLALTVVLVMKLAGVVLATALLVLPGVTALRLSDRLNAVRAISVGVAILGMLGGLVVSFETDWPAGPSIAVVLGAVYLGALAAGGARARIAQRRAARA